MHEHLCRQFLDISAWNFGSMPKIKFSDQLSHWLCSISFSPIWVNMPIAPESKLRAYGIDDHGLIRDQQVGLANRRVKFVMFQFQIFVLIYQSFGFQPSKKPLGTFWFRTGDIFHFICQISVYASRFGPRIFAQDLSILLTVNFEKNGVSCHFLRNRSTNIWGCELD